MVCMTGFLSARTVYDLLATVRPYSQNAHGAVRKNSLKMRMFLESWTMPEATTHAMSHDAKEREK